MSSSRNTLELPMDPFDFLQSLGGEENEDCSVPHDAMSPSTYSNNYYEVYSPSAGSVVEQSEIYCNALSSTDATNNVEDHGMQFLPMVDVICDDDVMARMIGNVVSVGNPAPASSTSDHHIYGNRRQDSTDTLPEYDNSTELTDISYSYQNNLGRLGHSFVVSSCQTTSVCHGNTTNATIPDLWNTNEDLHLDYTDKLEYATQLWEGIRYLPDQVERSFLGLPQTKASPPAQAESPCRNMAADKAAESTSKTLRGVECTYSRRAAVRRMTRNRRQQLSVSTVPSPTAQKSDCDDEDEDVLSPASVLSSTDDDENDMDYNSKVDGKQSRARSSGMTHKLPGIIQYLHTSLQEGQPYIEWIGSSKTRFRITKPNQIARIWGQRSNHKEGRKALDPNSDFKYEHFSRALRYYKEPKNEKKIVKPKLNTFLRSAPKKLEFEFSENFYRTLNNC